MNARDLERAAEFISSQVRTQGSTAEYAGRARFLMSLEQRKARTTRRVLGFVAVICAIAIGIAIKAEREKPRAVSYRVGTSAELGEIGSYVSAPAAARLDLNFSEGSRVVLEPGARGRVARSTSHGATMILEDGRASVDVVHRPDTEWKILAGPYVVQVAGTSFEVSYKVATQTFELDMHQGVVRVTGPGLAVPGEIRGTQRLLLSPANAENPSASSAVPADSSSVAAADSATQPSDMLATRPGLASHDSALPTTSSAPRAKRESAVDSESWTQLASRAQHRRIIDLAEKQGIDQVLDTAAEPDLFALANAARFSGKQHLAMRAYRAVRTRFSASPDATSAAFFLGRLYEGSDPANAIGWYDQYALEVPGGVWVAEALGRRMVLLNASLGAEAARKAAEDYLRRFANGPYAGFAQKILQP